MSAQRRVLGFFDGKGHRSPKPPDNRNHRNQRQHEEQIKDVDAPDGIKNIWNGNAPNEEYYLNDQQSNRKGNFNFNRSQGFGHIIQPPGV